QFNIISSRIKLLAGFAFFKAFVTGAHHASVPDELGFGQCGYRWRGRYLCSGTGFAHGDSIELASAARGFLGIGCADGPKVIRGLQAAHPGQLVDVVQLLARDARHEYVQRLGLVYPFGAARCAFNHPRWVDFESRGVELAQFVGDAIDASQAAIEILQVGNHDFVPQLARLQVTYQVVVDHGKFARQVGLDVQVAVVGFDAGRHTNNVRYGGRWRNGNAVG